MPANITLYFVRHGESVGNVDRSIPAAEDDVLTEKGKEQAEKLGKYFASKNVNFSRAYASDYPRTFETASLIVKHTKNLMVDDIRKDVRIREVSPGIFECKSYRETLKAVIASQIPVLDYEVPGGETRAEIYSRLESFLQETFTDLTTIGEENEADQTVLIVSHSFCLRNLMTYLYKTEKYLLVNESAECKKLMGNTSYMKILLNKVEKSAEDQEQKWRLEFLEIHGMEHLGEEGLAESRKRNETLKAFIAQTGQVEVLSGCIQS